MNSSEQLDQLGAALAAAQAEIPVIVRSRTVTVTSKRTGGKYTFAYAPYETIHAAVTPALSRHGLSVVQTPIGPVMATRLIHSSGQWIESQVPIIFDSGSAQEYGSAMTYARRYGLSALLNLATEEDDDANMAGQNEYTANDRNKPATADELQTIRELLEKTGTDEGQFWEWLGLREGDEVPAYLVPRAMSALMRKKAKAEKESGGGSND